MRIAVDAMGGDYGPPVTVEGAMKASEEYRIEVIMVGGEDMLRDEFLKHKNSKARVTIVNAPEAIGMGEGLLSFRKKKNSSIRVGTQLVKDGEADAFVSTGNTAAVVYISKKILGALKGVDKPALALIVPSLSGLTLLIDVGANVDCRPEHLEQFAVMGHIFMENVLGISNPRVGLMSIGEEQSKGNELTRQVFERLQASSLNFIGNVEGKDLYSGKAHVIVSDGFAGNVALKASEGLVETFTYMVRNEIMKSMFSKIGYFLMKRNLKKAFRKVDYSEYGGALLLGLNGICIVGHGRSNPNAVKNAVRLARDFVKSKVQERIKHEMARVFQATSEVKV
ncbi:MAG: phosphate acyltransferase PlsX [Candidatus Aminicenantales bacterium]